MYGSSIGSWVKYASGFEPLIKLFRSHLPRLRQEGALISEDKINWNMDPAFDYNAEKPSSERRKTRRKRKKMSEISEVSIGHFGEVSSIESSSHTKKKKQSHKKKTKTSKDGPAERKSLSSSGIKGKRKGKRARKLQESTGSPASFSSGSSFKYLAAAQSVCNSSAAASLPDHYVNMLAASFDFVIEDADTRKVTVCAYVCSVCIPYSYSYAYRTSL